jgi:hypothetical protein
MEDKQPDQLRAERDRFQAKAAEWQNAIRVLGEKMQAVTASVEEPPAAEPEDPGESPAGAPGS